MIQSTNGRKRPVRSGRSIHRALLEAVEARLLLCALHENGGNSVNITFYDSTSSAPLDLHFDPLVDAPIVGPKAELTTPAPALFNPITDWPTAANGLPILNSLPGAPTAVYLDFDGDTGSDTTAYSEDADSATYNLTEQTNIVEAWRQISAYFAMFDTNVTTAVTSLPKAWEVIGNNAGGATGGYAYVNSFPNSSPQAFNASGNARSRESGMAHEIGHVFGLQHQSSYDLLGVKTNEYISAVDSLHGAIMGVDYSGSVHKWFIGHSASGVTTLQDDMAMISGKIKAKEPAGGDGYRPDDFGGTIASATPMAVDGGMQWVSGIIERRTDIDSFAFTSDGGGMGLAAIPDSPSGVDLKLEIYDSSGNLIAAKDGATNDQQMALSLPAGTYYALVSSHGDYGDQGMYDFSVRSLPAGWNTADIGTTGLTGYTEFDPTTGVFTNAGAGSAVSGTADSFHYVYQSLTGDGEIVAQVLQNQNTNSSAKVGVDIRDGLANSAKHVALTLTPTGGTQFIYRSVLGGTASTVTGSTHALPEWVRLVRAGNLFTGYISSDGASWTQVSQTTISMNATVNIGLLTSSLTTSKLDVGQLGSVSITGDTTPVAPTYNALAAPTDLVVVPSATGTGMSLSWTDVADSTGFNVLRSTDGITFTQIATTAAGMTTYTDVNPGISMRYFYMVAARDASGASAPSAAASAVNRPAAPSGLSIISPSVNTLVVNWKDVSGDSGYRIERSTDGVNFSTVTTVVANVPSYTNTGLATGITYTYRIVTLSAEGDSLPSTTFVGATRLPAVTGAAFTTIGSTSITLHWTDIAGETGYRIDRSTDGTTWSTINSGIAANTTTYTDPTVLPLKEYYYRVYGTTAQALSLVPSSYIFAATQPTTALPAPWTSTDIGTVAGKGASGFSGGTYTLISSGSDIAGTSDSFRYTYRSLPADGQIIARVASLENTDANAKAGVMIRGSIASAAAYIGVFVTPGAGVYMQTRSATGSTTTTTAGLTTAVAPYWVKVVRSGNTLSGYYSSDGVTWTQVGTSITLNLGSGAQIGLASTSKSTTLLSTATVTNVTSNLAPTVTQVANATAVTNQNTATLSALGADDAGEAGLKYTWTVTSLPAGAATPTFSINGINAAKSTVATFTSAGVYQFMVTIADSAGLSVTSSVSVNVTLSVPPKIATPASAGTLGATGTIDLSVLGADDQGEANLTYSWATLAAPQGVDAPTFSINATNAAKNTTATLAAPGDYTFEVTVTDASGLSVTSDVSVSIPVGPVVTQIVYDFHKHLNVTFSEDVSQSLQKEDLTVHFLQTDEMVTPIGVTWDADSKTASFEFAADFADGDYQASLAAMSISDDNQVHPWSNTSLDFFAMAGDITRDRTVDFNDLVVLAQNYNTSEKTYAEGDLTGDGTVDFNDLVVLAQRYNTTLAALTPPAPAPALVRATPVAAEVIGAATATPAPVVATFSSKRITDDKAAGGDVLRKVDQVKPAPAPKKRVGR